MRYLVYVDNPDGHHLEYVEHLLQMSASSSDCFIFLLHPKFRRYQSINDTYSNKVSIIFLDETEIIPNQSRLKYSYKVCKQIKKKVQLYNVDHVFFIMLMPFGPFIFFPFFIKAKVSGIIYSIYLYRWKTSSIVKKIYDVMRFWLMARSSHIKSVFILNDESAASILNKLYKTTKFKYLVDPYQPIKSISNSFNLRGKYPEKIIVSHIGGIKERKGSYNIIKAINLMAKKDLDRFVFIFAGKAEDEVYFNGLLNQVKDISNVEYHNGFISFENIAEIVSASDILLLPYMNTNQSSGIIGYGAQFGVPVAVPNKELLGKLVKKNHLGYLMNGYQPEDISKFLTGIEVTAKSDKRYIDTHDVNTFNTTIRENIK